MKQRIFDFFSQREMDEPKVTPEQIAKFPNIFQLIKLHFSTWKNIS
ncbi:hypothetical protein HMPREF0645_2792 [Hallella bergensis DSM 17361]|uniref:Uncharacterized protein n=1 Tax=Hallella bergensis DSM 17361 TaxID=585502 RepID=D1Q0Q7_9BACT|nr:hypothetical protein HMPREF0645_2792 [Hallella bergensis DSM 17361]